MSRLDERAHLIAETLETLRRFAEAEFSASKTVAVEPELEDAPPCESQDMRNLRNFISARVEAFRTRQQLLQIEREARYELEMHRIRAVTQEWGLSA